MRSYVLAGVAAAAVAALTLGADKPAKPPEPLRIMAQGGRVVVKGEHFLAVADRAEVDPGKNAVALSGRDGEPASVVFQWPDKPLDRVKAQRITIDLATGTTRADDADSARTGDGK
jgi:hypothetical protein